MDSMVAKMIGRAMEDALGKFMVAKNPRAMAQSGGWGMSSLLCAGVPTVSIVNGVTRANPPGTVPALQLSVNFPKADMHTVQVGLSTTMSGVVGGTVVPPYSAIVTVVWTVNGISITRQFDLGQGASISAPAEAVQVTIQDVTPGVYHDNGVYRVYATVTPRTRYGTTPLTLTGTPVLVPAISGSTPGVVAINVPKNVGAKSVGLMLSPSVIGTTVNAVVQQQSYGGEGPTATVLGSYTYVDTSQVPLLNGANQILVQNLRSGTYTATPIWGIEG